jgi:hypothetical protein
MQLRKNQTASITSGKKHQSSKPGRIRESLALATCSLLATVPTQVKAAGYQAPWEIDGTFLYYSEKDRVTAYEPVLGLRKEIGDDEFVNFKVVADALTGASPNGAVPTNTPQTFTSPSGNHTYTSPANEIPMDKSFKDFRIGINGDWEKPLSRTLKGIFGASFSTETDYTSLGLSSSFSKDLNERQTTLTLGLSANLDSVNPTGGAPKALSTMSTAAFPSSSSSSGEGEGEGGIAGKSKNTGDLLLGITQVINRTTLTQLNYSLGMSAGYLNDPYKVLSVLEADNSGNLRTTDSPYVYEKRPDSRTYQSIYWKGVHQFSNENVIHISYRYFWDDWNIKSHTVDLHYRLELGSGHYLQPHLRYYHQTAASFYRQSLIDGEEKTLKYASADYRLGDFTSKTIGLKYGILYDSGSEINFRIEKIQTDGKTRKQDAIGKLQNTNLYPNLDATVIQAGISVPTGKVFKFLGEVFDKNK